MAVAQRAEIPPFLMTLMVGHGCIAGALSPIAPTGIIANGLMSRMGMSGYEGRNYLSNLVANTLAAGMGYFLFGGWRLFRLKLDERSGDPAVCGPDATVTLRHWATLGMIAIFFVGVIAFRVHVGLAAFAAAVVLVPGKDHR